MGKKTKAKKKRKNLPILGLFFLGLLIAIYPIISNYYYRIEANKEIADFVSEAKKISPEELARKLELARQYNRTLDPGRLADPYSESEKEGRAEYARMLQVQEKIGFVSIPQIDQNLPVYAGSSEAILQKGVGHLEGTSLPIGGPSTHAVLTAHRGLPRAKLFRELDKLKVGDVFYFQNIETTLAYEVDQILTVEPWNFEPVLVQEGMDYMTLLTCTPYMVNSHRLLVRGHRVDYVPPVNEKALGTNGPSMAFKTYLIVALVVLFILLVIAIRLYLDYRKKKKEVEQVEEVRDEEKQ